MKNKQSLILRQKQGISELIIIILVLAMLAVAGFAFWYYYKNIKLGRDEARDVPVEEISDSTEPEVIEQELEETVKEDNIDQDLLEIDAELQTL